MSGKPAHLKAKIADLCILIGGFLILTPSAILFFSAINFWLGFPLTSLPMLAGPLLAILVIGWELRNLFHDSKTRWVVAGLLLVTFLVVFFPSWFASRKLYDLTVDGQTYHASGIDHLLHGWNPFRDNPLPTEANFYNQYVNHYPKGPWILAASFIRVTGHVEDGKIFNFLLLLGGFLIILSALLEIKNLKTTPAFLLAILVAFNPITLSQLASYYVDGQLASLLVILLGIMILWTRRADIFLAILLASVILLMVNVKFTGFIYSLLIAGALTVYWFIKTRAVSLPVTFISSLIIAVLLIGFNPYGTNTIYHRNPFYPIHLFSDQEDPIVYYQLPENFRNMGRIERLVFSLFAKPNEELEPAQLKLPFTMDYEELSHYDLADLRVGGFGPQFSGALLLSILIWAWIGYAKVPGRKKVFGFYLLILVSIMVNSASWWARFAPQIWLLPLIPVGLAFTSKRGRGLHIFAWVTVLVLVVNIGLVAGVNFTCQIGHTEFIKYQLATIREKSYQQPVQVAFNLYSMNKMRFDEWGIRYQTADEIKGCSESLKLYASDTKICLDSVLDSNSR